MVKRPKPKNEEIMLIPFLDILCSLIGVLVLIIVVLVVAQTQRVTGRTQEEIDRAQNHLKLLKLKQESTIKYKDLAEKLQQLTQLQSESQSKSEQAEKLKTALADAVANREKNQASAAKLQQELENLLTEIRGLTQQEPALRTKIAELLEALAKMAPPEKKDPSVIINPTGSGLAAGTAVFFVDATGDKLTFFWNEKQKSVVSAVPEVIVADEAFNSFLEQVKKIPQSKIIFLLRDDGMRSYNLGAGWAQSKHGYKVEQIGKLPAPGRGDLDLRLFGKLLGNLPAPAVANPPPAPNPAAPAPPAMATPGMMPPAAPGSPPSPPAAAKPALSPAPAVPPPAQPK